MANNIKILKNGVDTGVRGKYTTTNGTVIPIEDVGTVLGLKNPVPVKEIAKLLNMQAHGLGNAVDFRPKGKTSTPAPAPAKPKQRLKGKRIAFDIAHGEPSNLNQSPVNRSYTEAAFLLKMVVPLREKFEAEGATVYFSRTGKKTVPINTRLANINAFKPDLVISPHTDAAESSVRGVHVIHPLSRPNDKLAKLAMKHVAKQLGMPERKIWTKATSTGKDWYAAIRLAKAHSIIIEGGYHTNKEDVAILLQPDAHIRYAQGILDAVIEFYA